MTKCQILGPLSLFHKDHNSLRGQERPSTKYLLEPRSSFEDRSPFGPLGEQEIDHIDDRT